MHNDELVLDAIGLYTRRMENLLEGDTDLSVLELRRRHSAARFEAVDHFIKNCKFEVNTWKLEKAIREEFGHITSTYKSGRKLNMFAAGLQHLPANVTIESQAD